MGEAPCPASSGAGAGLLPVFLKWGTLLMENKEDNQEKKPYSFMKEIIKKKPLDKRALLLKIAGVAAAAVAAGIIAAFVFVKMVPVAEQVLGTSEEPPKVNIPADEEPTATATPEATPTPTVVDTPQATPNRFRPSG